VKQSSVPEENKSLKTFAFYSGFVILLISISLLTKVFFIIKQSKFDSNHQFIVSIAQGNNVKEVLAYDPVHVSLAQIQIVSDVSQENLGKEYGIIVDGTISVRGPFPFDEDPTRRMTALLWQYHTVQTDLTFYDLLRLMVLSKRIALQNIQSEKLTSMRDQQELDQRVQLLLTDKDLVSENVTIQIINATAISGMGGRLERVISNLGGNVVAISTARQTVQKSEIQYSNDKAYSYRKLRSLLLFPTTALNTKSIADIVITIGTDSNNTKKF
jgi:hypothetical protein